MGYLFLTGATGLLGSYLVRDLLGSGTRLAVLVRPTRFASARQRVESLVARWEQQAGYSLPRPVVLAGDVSRADLGLSAAQRAWVARNCTSLLHNAASLTFYAESSEGEPWRSNLQGTHNVLAFCRETGIGRLHHVSTAYVCGLRRDRVLEAELDVGQQHGNDYEVSKFESEKAVRSAGWLDEVTVYRPGIILGDSQTGYTTTFHGFYVPLKLVSTLIDKTAGLQLSGEELQTLIGQAGERLRSMLRLSGQECKNYVPVDWVSAVMTHIYRHPEHHGRTYHLTPRQPASVAMTQRVMQQAFIRYSRQTRGASGQGINWGEFEKFFIEGMEVYRSYWRDDPQFDHAHTSAAAPQLPCPELSEAMFLRMCRYAIESNFGWPRPAEIKPELDVGQHLEQAVHPEACGDGAGRGPLFVGLQVNGRGGGQWELAVQEGRLVAAAPGLSGRCTATYYLNSNTFGRLARRETTAEGAIVAGRVLIEGNGVPPRELARALTNIAAPTS